MTKKAMKNLALILSAVFLAGSLLFRLDLPVSAEEVLPPDGTLLSEETGHESFSSEMLTAALARYRSDELPVPMNALPDSLEETGKILEYASMPYTGNAYAVAFHVDFQDQTFVEGDTEEALQSALGRDLEGNLYPSMYNDQYSSIYGYYQRASYGKLAISGDTFSWHAKKTKAEYEESSELIKEILDALDEEVDFSRYDADKDGRIDCIYLHIPYDTADEWNTPWWPNCSSMENFGDLEYDGVRPASRIVISRILNAEDGDGVRTIIHETGHAMGFPDYYSYDRTSDPAGGDNLLSGILTFDMMDSDIGDHNGFSKWIAGWLEEDDVTRVVANESVFYATRGGQPVGEKNEDGSITLDLGSFDSDTLEETGGIIVVGNDGMAPFSDYFLIQYDTFAGNQKVFYNGPTGDGVPLPSGFRVFRVQADLNEYGTLNHSNTNGSLYNKLIELVDPDYKADHKMYSAPYIPSGFGQDTYSCMFYAGSSLTPTSGPSTNFRENINVGFTGISIEFLETGGEKGKLKISYSDDDKPVMEPLDITLTEGIAAPAGFKVTLKGNRALIFGIFGSAGVSASVKEGDEFIASDGMREYSLEGDTITGTFYFDTDVLLKGRTVIVRCREGAFDLGTDEWSPPFYFELPVQPYIAELSESGLVEGTETEERREHILSPIRQNEDGSYSFYGYVGTFLPMVTTDIYKYTFTEDNPAGTTRELLASESEERREAADFISNVYLKKQTDGALSIPENAELGDYPVVLDAVKIGDYYYTVSFRELDYTSFEPDRNQMAVSKLDANGKLLEQVFPAGDDIQQDPETSTRVRIQAGPNEKIAVLLFRPFQNRNYDYPFNFTNRMGTFFFDQDLNLEARLDNFSTGCGTWLKDGRFISFGQRNQTSSTYNDMGIRSADMVCYDITSVLDPAPAIEYKIEDSDSGEMREWKADSEEELSFAAHRNIDDPASKDHYLGVSVDEKELTEGTDYTVDFASVHISLLPSYLKTLSEGTHTLTVLFDDGKAESQFTIQKVLPPTPVTGDSSRPVIWIILMAAALCVAAVVVVLLIRKRK